MALDDSMAAALKSANYQTTTCTFGRILRRMPADDRATVLAWLADEEKTTAVIGAALRNEGYDIKDNSARRHRRGECTC